MDDVVDVRRFNRTVTQRVGALHDSYLARRRPLGASRVLWEIGAEGCEARTLRARLDLDSGYLSRLLRGLETEGLVTNRPDPSDRRVRRIELTTRGRRERELLDRASDDLARSLLEPLSGSQRAELLAAMGTVERLLTAGMVRVAVEDPSSANARSCLQAYFAELDERFDSGFDPGRSLPADEAELRPPSGLMVVGTLHGEPVACGAVVQRARRTAEIKRMWVAPASRGLGVGRRILAELEEHARRLGARRVRLETNRSLTEALGLYRSSGFVEVAAFNDEPYADHWFEKRLRVVSR